MTQKLLSILIPTCRGAKFNQLMKSLLLQTTDAVEVLVWPNSGQHTIGYMRQKLLEHSYGRYVAFIDDDDWVPPYYTSNILEALAKNPDYVGFYLNVYTPGKPMKIANHSIKNDGWYETDRFYYRDLTISNPIRRTIARMGDFNAHSSEPEDYAWVQQVRGRPKTEIFIPQILYHYRFDPADSVQHKVKFDPTWDQQLFKRPNVRVHPLAEAAHHAAK